MAMGKFESEAADVQVQFGGELGRVHRPPAIRAETDLVSGQVTKRLADRPIFPSASIDLLF